MAHVEVPMHITPAMPTIRAMQMTMTFRHIDRSGALESRARELGERLRRYHSGITLCHVTVEGAVDHRAGGSNYAVRIHLSVPGAQIHADSGHHDGMVQRDVYIALRDAYASARRQLQDLRRDHGKSSLASRARLSDARR
jgi:ribosome-associated translation inhibitor RaiA